MNQKETRCQTMPSGNSTMDDTQSLKVRAHIGERTVLRMLCDGWTPGSRCLGVSRCWPAVTSGGSMRIKTPQQLSPRPRTSGTIASHACAETTFTLNSRQGVCTAV